MVRTLQNYEAHLRGGYVIASALRRPYLTVSAVARNFKEESDVSQPLSNMALEVLTFDLL
jgi:hypothetical protein